MLFTSYGFIAFLAVLFALYYVIPKRFQWLLLLAADIVFYACAGWKAKENADIEKHFFVKCPHCGEEQSVSRLEKLEEAECSECGEKGLVMMEDDEHGT